jgi:DNA mismatch repair protein MutL
MPDSTTTLTRAGRIRLLPELTVNRIAAGEVIERPAAAARELVENALDAGATRIAVAILAGGIARIEVADDGMGMSAAELALAVQRHATSKLADDSLVSIATLGFRGEALPSIGAAARLAITTRPAGASHAATIRVEGGAVGEVTPAPGAQGTRVVVADLFFATPARRKFLKSPRAEAEATETAIRRLAFSAPGVAFRFDSDGRVVFDLPAQDRATRVAALLAAPSGGPAGTPNGEGARLIELAEERNDMRLAGFIGPAALTRATQAGQALMVNGRPVADPVLRTAVRLAYRDVIAPGRYPVAALYLQVPPELVDVNVHPAKAEVRFADPNAVRSLVIGALTRALAAGASGAPSAPLPRFQGGWRPGLSLVPPSPPRPAGGFAEPRLAFGDAPSARTLPFSDRYHGPFAAAEAPSAASEGGGADFPLGAPVAQVLDTYVIAVAADGSLVLVDQHAAHERLTHEAIRAQMIDGGVRRQPLLLPSVVDLPANDAARLIARADDLALLGLEIEAFGAGAVLVRALPAALGAPDPGPLLRDLADEFAELDESSALATRLDAVIARLACHGSIRAGRRLTGPEMDALLRRMEATPRAATCSHGRPTFLKLSKAEIERLFGRR